MDENKIERGDIVDILFGDNGPDSIIAGTVLYTPCATGDSWHIDDSGTIMYVQNYSKMILLEKRDLEIGF